MISATCSVQRTDVCTAAWSARVPHTSYCTLEGLRYSSNVNLKEYAHGSMNHTVAQPRRHPPATHTQPRQPRQPLIAHQQTPRGHAARSREPWQPGTGTARTRQHHAPVLRAPKPHAPVSPPHIRNQNGLQATSGFEISFFAISPGSQHLCRGFQPKHVSNPDSVNKQVDSILFTVCLGLWSGPHNAHTHTH